MCTRFCFNIILPIIFMVTVLCSFKVQASSQEIENLKQNALNGDICAAFDLGNHLLNSQEIDQAYEWYSKAAEKGHAQAQENLCEMYFYGVGGKRDLSQARKWCESAAQDKASVSEGTQEQTISKRTGAVWKAAYIHSIAPDTDKAVYISSFEHEGHAVQLPAFIGSPTPGFTDATCVPK